ncbi:MAG: hypothetical protein UY04_C0027G0002 [Parcubacteria group bacterium GW2011_GWA2_47_7]|nr:MAG: hypothetical protein UY04_C0027G0002 [Parcubacteria group bacterium GW2011_GWA2_47_7]
MNSDVYEQGEKMKNAIAVIVVTTTLFGIFGAATWTPDIAGINFFGTVLFAAIAGAFFGVIIATITGLIGKIIK